LNETKLKTAKPKKSLESPDFSGKKRKPTKSKESRKSNSYSPRLGSPQKRSLNNKMLGHIKKIKEELDLEMKPRTHKSTMLTKIKSSMRKKKERHSVIEEGLLKV